MVAQSEQAFLTIAKGKALVAPTVKILEYKRWNRFFVAGDGDAP